VGGLRVLALLWARLVALSRLCRFGRSHARNIALELGLRLMLGIGLGSVLYLPLWIVKNKDE
jgi:hypothetical protein